MYTPKPLEKKVTLPTLNRLKRQGEKFACLTAYDYSFARLLEKCGVEVVLVGDSLGMVIQGHATTLPVTVEDIEYHARTVYRGLEHAMLMVDMPFGSLNSQQQALDNASRLMKNSGAQIVKLEGGITQIRTVETLSHYGIPVCAHLGLQPQSVHKMGGYRIQGREHDSAVQMKDTALQLQESGADMLLLECVPRQLAAEITTLLQIPVIGIGAGAECDGQILVLQDMLGITDGKTPSFAKNYMATSGGISEAIESYVTEVKNRVFPGDSQCFD
jgi:3-methyl-2-oxobutanoate hydroxymethyltransferase